MAETGSRIEEVRKRQVVARQASLDARGTAAATFRARAEDDLVRAVVAVRETEDAGAILAAEKILLLDEYSWFANTPLTRASLEAALEEVDAALAMVEMVQDPETYRVRVDETHRVRKHRAGAVPKDDARVFFAGRVTRLANWEKARGTDEEKALLTARRASIRKAGRIYQGHQREALGIADGGRGGR